MYCLVPEIGTAAGQPRLRACVLEEKKASVRDHLWACIPALCKSAPSPPAVTSSVLRICLLCRYVICIYIYTCIHMSLSLFISFSPDRCPWSCSSIYPPLSPPCCFLFSSPLFSPLSSPISSPMSFLISSHLPFPVLSCTRTQRKKQQDKQRDKQASKQTNKQNMIKNKRNK